MQTDRVKLLLWEAWSFFFNQLSFLKPGLVNIHHTHAKPLDYSLPALSYRQMDLAPLSNIGRANSDVCLLSLDPSISSLCAVPCFESYMLFCQPSLLCILNS